MGHPTVMKSMVGCQEQTMSMLGDPGWDGFGQPESHHSTSGWYVI